MAALSAASSVFVGKAVQATQIRAKAPKASVVVKASASEKTSKAVSLAAAGVIALSATPAFALNAIELQDRRETNKNGLQLIYEARDLNISQSPREEGASRFSFQKLTTAQTVARATESLKRINEDLPGYISKAYWTQAANEERRQLNTLRYDINNLVEEKGGDKKAAKDFYRSIEKMDFAIRQKDQATAQAAVAECQEKGNALLKSLA